MNSQYCLAVLALSLLSSVPLARGAETEKKPDPAKAETRSATNAVKNINASEFEKLRSDKQNTVLDVRTAREFAAGHVPGAVNIDVNSPEFETKVGALDPARTYLVHCAAGVRSAKACDKLSKLKFEHLYNLEGGMKAWEKAGNKPER
jgi:rhodanese-related sulfurtransferase